MKIRGNTVGTNIKPDKFNPLPPVTKEDEGKTIVVENGVLVLKKVEIPSYPTAEGVRF